MRVAAAGRHREPAEDRLRQLVHRGIASETPDFDKEIGGLRSRCRDARDILGNGCEVALNLSRDTRLECLAVPTEQRRKEIFDSGDQRRHHYRRDPESCAPTTLASTGIHRSPTPAE